MASERVSLPPFFRSIRARLLLIALLLLLIPLIGYRFLQEMDRYLREGHQQVLTSAARLLSATLSDRPQLFSLNGEVSDAEADERRRLLALFSSADPEAAASLGTAYVPSSEIERMLGVVANSASRIWVVDAQSRVRGLSGSLQVAAPAGRNVPDAAGGSSLGARIYGGTVRPLLRAIADDGTGGSIEDPTDARRAVMRQVDRALVGEPNLRWRSAVKGSAEILAVAQPIWQGDNIVGAVVLEETTEAGKSIKSAALESLLATTMIVFAVGFVALIAFAWRLASRVRRLQNEADHAIDTYGRIRGDIAGTTVQDEIGALSRTLNGTLQRLKRYNDYLEKMAARLSHELRTPVAVVRSSLDNLRVGNIAENDRVYIERADEGVQRLSSLIARMSEASQLERMLASTDLVVFNLGTVVRGCVEGYRLAYSQRVFQFESDSTSPIFINGSADAIAQMLDKLIQNAVDFATSGTAIRIALANHGRNVMLTVENDGPLLPANAAAQLFVSMVSSRSDGAAHGDHLGLGLYIVRLIAEFHGGNVNAANNESGRAVCFTVTFPCHISPPYEIRRIG